MNPLAGDWAAGSHLLIVSAAELLLLVLLLLRMVIRRRGGGRRAWRGLRRQLRLTRKAFTDPLRDFLQFRSSVRRLAAALPAALPGGPASAALLDLAARAPGTTVVAVTASPSAGRVTVRTTGRAVSAPPAPWTADGDPRRWSAPAAALAAPGPGGAPEPLLVPVGLEGGALLALDLRQGPGVLAFYGGDAPVLAAVQAVAAHVDALTRTARVLVSREVHPKGRAPDLDTLLAGVESAPDADPPVVVCAGPTPAQAERLARLAAAGALYAVVAGRIPVHCWELRIDPRGRLHSPALDVGAEIAPLAPAVARRVRKGGPAKPPARPAATRAAAPAPASPTPARPAAPDVAQAPAQASHTPAPEPVPYVPEPYAHTPEPEPEPHATPEPEPSAPAPRPPYAAPAPEPAPTAPAGASGGHGTGAPAGGAVPRQPAAGWHQPVPEPPSPAVSALFAEPETARASDDDRGGASSAPRSGA